MIALLPDAFSPTRTVRSGANVIRVSLQDLKFLTVKLASCICGNLRYSWDASPAARTDEEIEGYRRRAHHFRGYSRFSEGDSRVTPLCRDVGRPSAQWGNSAPTDALTVAGKLGVSTVCSVISYRLIAIGGPPRQRQYELLARSFRSR